MEMLMTPARVIGELVKSWNEVLRDDAYACQGVMELCLDKERYFIEIGAYRLNLVRETSRMPELSVYCSFEDWIALLSGKLWPWWGVLSGRLRVKGKTACLRQLPRVDFTGYLCDEEDKVTDFETDPSRYWVPPERVLIINASPRKGKGYTSFLSAYLKRGIDKVVAVAEVVELEDCRIEACCGCWHCWLQSEGQCIYDGKDDGRELLDRMDQSDLLVFAFPLYSDGVPAGLKRLLDRRIATLKPQMVPGIKKTRHPRRAPRRQAIAVLSVSGFVEKVHFQAVKEYFRSLAHNWHTPLVGELYRPAAMALFNHPLYYPLQREVLSELENAGTELARWGRIGKRTRNRVEQNFISEDEFRACANYFWKKNR